MWEVTISILCSLAIVRGEAPYRFFTWDVTFGNIYPLGDPQTGILINGQFPGPDIFSVTDENIVVDVRNHLNEPFLLSWNGVQQRKNSFEDGVSGTTCLIPPGQNFTYRMQMKDQIGSFYYFPSSAFHKAAGGFGGIRILNRPEIPLPFPEPSGDFTVLVGDWYRSDHSTLKAVLDQGNMLPPPDSILINGKQTHGTDLTFERGKTYRLRISNVGLQNSINFRIQGHRMKLVEVEGTHTVQTSVTSLDVHVGQSYSVLVTADRPARDYHIVASLRFASSPLAATSILHYSDSRNSVSRNLPPAPTDIQWSINQARSIRMNLTAGGPRPNPQGSYRYGRINVNRTIILANSHGRVNNRQRYAVNDVSFVPASTPLKLADYFNIQGVFRVGSIPDQPPGGRSIRLDTSVMGVDYRAFVEIVFENRENTIQSWHLDGYSFFVVGMDGGSWSPSSRRHYNLVDAVSRSTTQVYPMSWTAVYVALDNVGMWNLRSEFWARQYLGQQLYLRVYTPTRSERDEYHIPSNALLCGRARGMDNRVNLQI